MLGRWPTSLTLRVRTNGPTGAVLSRAKRFPPFADVSSYVPAEALPPQRADGATAGGGAAPDGAHGERAEEAPRPDDTHELVMAMAESMFQVRGPEPHLCFKLATQDLLVGFADTRVKQS